MPSQHCARRIRGFTLIELLVALSVMALLALMSWRGIDGMVGAQTQVRERMDGVATLQTGLAQWSADLDALMETGDVPGVEFDGRVLRLTRRDLSRPDGALMVVGWARLNVASQHGGKGSWVRWQSPPVRSRGDLQKSWTQAQQWAQSAGGALRPGEVAVVGLDQWQLFFFREGAWSNPLSSAGTPSAANTVGPAASPVANPAIAPVPDGIRLVLNLSAGQPLGGALSKDWVRPALGGGKS